MIFFSYTTRHKRCSVFNPVHLYKNNPFFLIFLILKRAREKRLKECARELHTLVTLSPYPSMAALSCYSPRLQPLSSSTSTSSSTQSSLITTHSPPTLSRCSPISLRPKLGQQTNKLFVSPALVFLSSNGFEASVDTQTFIATISVLVTIALSLFLGLKVITTTHFLFSVYFLSCFSGNYPLFFFSFPRREIQCLVNAALEMVSFF